MFHEMMLQYTSLVKQQQGNTQNFEKSFERKFKNELTKSSGYDIIYFADKTGNNICWSTKSEGMKSMRRKPYLIK